MLSGPWAADILGDQGADVIKVESPGGDHVRSMRNQVAGTSAWFANINRSKRSLCLDLKTRRGVDIVARLAARSDVVVQNFRPGVVERLGVDFETLSRPNRQLVYLSISGYGETGPYRDHRVYDPLVQAMSGLASIQAGSDTARPRLIRTVLPDKLTSMAGAQAICAALVARSRTGEGQHIKLSMLDTVLSFLWASDMNDYTFADQPVGPAPSASSVDLVYDTADGFIAVSTMTNQEWTAFCAAARRPDLLADERFATSAGRDEFLDERLCAIQDVLREKPTALWLSILKAHDVPCAPVLRRAELLDDPQVHASGAIRIHDHPDLGRLRQATPAPVYGDAPSSPPLGAPRLGQHSREILAAAGFAPDQINELAADGVIRVDPADTGGAAAHAPNTAPATRKATMATKLIVGADTGIGNALARHLHARGDRVIAGCLRDGSELVEAGIEVITTVDVTSDDAVVGLAKGLRAEGVELEWLLHVAGIMRLDTLDTVDFDEARRMYEVNTLGPLRVVRALRELLAPAAKVGIVTSRVGSLGDNSSGGDFGYRVSKAGANMVTLNLHHELAEYGYAVQALHPGMVDTDLLAVVDPELRSRYAAISVPPATSAEQLVAVMDALTVENSGRFQHANGSYLPW
jgi:crotonobetainyl-CoA:carnitine CoA-transferase CaiB-like acyl-CoA transferase/NAD(P)-dependent dehydrogenase (short-subunit alcohol dehydrogenase family)